MMQERQYYSIVLGGPSRSVVIAHTHARTFHTKNERETGSNRIDGAKRRGAYDYVTLRADTTANISVSSRWEE